MPNSPTPIVGIIMGSKSDWPVIKHTADILDGFQIPFEKRVLSAHRMTDEMVAYAREAVERGLRVIIGGAGGAAHLPGMIAANTPRPVIGVPMYTKSKGGIDSLLSIQQMPLGTPVATMSIGEEGAKNAAYLAARIIGISDKIVLQKIVDTNTILHQTMASALSDSPAPFVGIIREAKSSASQMKPVAALLEAFGMACEERMVPKKEAADYVRHAYDRGMRVIIVAAEENSRFPRTIAARTPLPVVGIQIQTKDVRDLDFALSLGHMPFGATVATMSIGEKSIGNAAIYAARILGISNPAILEKVLAYNEELHQKALQMDREVSQE